MWDILLKTVPVNLRRDIGTYLIMGFLVAVGMYIAGACAGISYSYVQGFEDNNYLSNSEDGQFQLRHPLGEREEQAIQDKGYAIERAFYFDVDMDDGSVVRVMKTRQSIDQIVLDVGELPQTDGEAVLEKCYAYYHSVNVSDTLHVGNEDLRISGIGSVTDYDMPSIRMNDFSSDSDAFGLIFVTDTCYQSMLSALGSDVRETYVYAYKLVAETSASSAPSAETSTSTATSAETSDTSVSDDELRSLLVDDLGLSSNLSTFVPVENNNRMGSAKDDYYVYAYVGIIVGIGLLVLISAVFFLRIQFSLEKQSPSIGALLAMGTKKSEIYPMLLLPFVLVATVGGLVGFLASCAFPLEGVVGNEGYYSIPEIPMITHPLIFLYCVLMPPLVCTLVSLFLMRKKMAQTAASLLVSSSESSGGSGGIVGVTIIGSLLAAAIFMVGRGVGTYATTVAERLPDEIQYNYVYELAEEHKTIPAGAQGAYRHTFSVEDHGYIRDIQFIGIEQGNRYFNVSVADLNGDVIISSAIASRYGLQSGDSLSVFDPLTAESFDFDIREVADYNVQLAIFMDIGDLRSLLDKDGVAFNMVYSDAPLSFSKSQLFDSATKEELIAPVEQLGPEVRSSRNVLYTLGILFYSVMMIYLFQFAVVRKRRDVACLSSLGYRNGEIALSLTGKLVVLACVSAAVSLLVGYHVSLPLMPELLASTPIGIILDYHLPDYLLHLLVATGIILLSALLALWRIASTDILFYLRNRE